MIDYEKEKREALAAGNKALMSLNSAKEAITKAKEWGILDLIGGGFFVSLLKKERMTETKAYLDEAFRDVQMFSKELGDLNLEYFPDLQTQDFLITADWLFDNFFVDLMVQKRLNETAMKIDEAIARIERILPSLY